MTYILNTYIFTKYEVERSVTYSSKFRLQRIQMKTPTKRIDGFDKINSFGIEYKNYKGQKDVKGCLMQGYQKDDDGIYWAMSRIGFA